MSEVEETETDATRAVLHETGYDFRSLTDTQMLSLGVPTEWLDRVRLVVDEDSFLKLELPEEVWERLYRLSQNEEIVYPKPVTDPSNISSSLENRRRLHVIGDSVELQAILNRSFEEWMLYLHPSQRSIVEGQFNGPLKITGVAGTGKTVVAMHRAKHLAKGGAHVLLTTFSRQLCESLRGRLEKFCTPEERALISVTTVHGLALRLLRKTRPAVEGLVSSDLREHASLQLPTDLGDFERTFVIEEWLHVVGEQGINSWEEYKEAPRVGRGTPLSASQRERLWAVFAPLISRLEVNNGLPWSFVCRQAREAIEDGRLITPLTAVIVDEVQDLSTQDIRFLASLAVGESKDLILIGDAGQRIYSGGFSLRKMGIEVRGRSKVLKVNYRTTREIMQAAARLRDRESDDLDEGREVPSGVQDLLSGAKPVMQGFNRYEDENRFVGAEVARLISDGIRPSEIALFAPTSRQRWHFEQELRRREIPYRVPKGQTAPAESLHVGSMHSAKGLEFRVAFVVGCQQGQVPNQVALNMAIDPEAKRQALTRERNLLYVCMTRAREQLYLTWTGWKSELLKGIQ